MTVQVSQDSYNTIQTMLQVAQEQLDGTRYNAVVLEQQVADLTAIRDDLEVIPAP